MDRQKAYEWHKSMLEIDNGEVEDVLEAAELYIEELEEENSKLEDEVSDAEDEINDLKKENEDLKSQIKIYEDIF